MREEMDQESVDYFKDFYPKVVKCYNSVWHLFLSDLGLGDSDSVFKKNRNSSGAAP